MESSSIKVPKKQSAAAGKKRSAEETSPEIAEPTSVGASGKGKAKKAKKTGSTRASSGKSSSKAANTNQSKAGPSADDVSKLLHWLSRDKLERLITSSVTTKTALSPSDLKNALPAEAKWRFSSASSPGILKTTKTDGPVKAGRERVNTGLFDGLDTVLMGNILHRLNVKERYLCCTSVAKSWRGFKTKIPGLFVDLSDDSFKHTEVKTTGYENSIVLPLGVECSTTTTAAAINNNNSSSGGASGSEAVRTYTSHKAMTAAQVLALLEWVPDLSAVTGLRISTRDNCNPNTCKAIIKKLVAAKKKAKKSMDLTKLVLFGPKIYGSVLAEAVKGGIGPALTSLTIADVKTTKQTKMSEGCVLDLLRTCSRLQELVMPQTLVVENSTLRAHLAALSAARSGATTLLRVLDMSGSTWGADRMRFAEIADIGKYAPELEVLQLEMATGIPTWSADDQAAGIPAVVAEYEAAFLREPMKELPRLREFGLGSVVQRYVYGAAPRNATTAIVNRILSWLLAGMPKVESFAFGHGESQMSHKDAKIYKTPSLPGIGGDDATALHWPATLKDLRLDTLVLEKDAFKSVQLPALETFFLKGAGPHMEEIVRGMKATHNHLTVGICRMTSTYQSDSFKRNNYLHGACLTSMTLPHLFDPRRPRMVYMPVFDEDGEDAGDGSD